MLQEGEHVQGDHVRCRLVPGAEQQQARHGGLVTGQVTRLHPGGQAGEHVVGLGGEFGQPRRGRHLLPGGCAGDGDHLLVIGAGCAPSTASISPIILAWLIAAILRVALAIPR